MGGMTAHGFPFPTGSDRVMDGDNAIQALAEKVDSEFVKRPHVEYGSVSIPALSSGQSTAATPVVFPIPFTSAPSIVMTTGNGRVVLAVVTPTLTGFSFVATNLGSGGSGVHTSWWIAAGDRQTPTGTTLPGPEGPEGTPLPSNEEE
jgi:hypothetical protein